MAEKSQKRVAEILADPRCKEMQRTFQVEREGIDKEKRTVELSFASEQPVDRWFGREILDITAESVDLTRLNSGGALLVNHNWDAQIGVVEKAWVDKTTKKARAIVKFSRSAAGEEIFQDVQDGIRSLVSVGYVVRKMVLQSVEGDVETHRVTDWAPHEISVVSVPADTSVGVGRSQPKEDTAPAHSAPAPATRTQSRSMNDDEKKTQEAAAEMAKAARESAIKAERARTKEINDACAVYAGRHPSKADELRTLAAKCAEAGDDVNAFNRSVLADILKTDVSAPPATRQGDAKIGMSDKEVKRYSILRAINALANNQPLSGLERECSDELTKKLGRQARGFFLPDEIVARAYSEKRAQTVVVPADGGYTVPTELLASEFMELLRKQTRVVELGGRYIGGLQGDISIPRQLTGSTAYWVSETGSITASGSTFGQVVGRPRRLGTSVAYSKQLLAQSSLGIESFVVDDSDKNIAVELDRVAINGAGGSEPLGILNLTSTDLGGTVTFGAAATWAKYLEFWSDLAAANAVLGSPAYLTTPASAVKAMTIPKFSNTATPIWENDMVGTFRARWSNQFPSGDKVIFGDFSQVLFLEWAGRDVVVDPYSQATTGNVIVTIQRLIDVVIRQSKAFDISTDSGAQ